MMDKLIFEFWGLIMVVREGKPNLRIKLLKIFSVAVHADWFVVGYACAYLVEWSMMVIMYSYPPKLLLR